MKINLKTLEAEGSPAEVMQIVKLMREEKCPEPNLTVQIEQKPKPAPAFAWKAPRKRTSPINWERAEELRAQGMTYEQMAEELDCSPAAVYKYFAKLKKAEKDEPGD